VNSQEWVEVNAGWLERNVRFYMGLVSAGVGLVLVLRHADWDFSWMLLAAGVGLAASRWVPREIYAGPGNWLGRLTGLAGAARRPLHLSSLTLLALWLVIRPRAKT